MPDDLLNPGGPLPRPNAELEARAEEICSRLLIERYVPKRNYRDLLLDDELRAIVARRLGGVGLQLVESFTSDWFAVRLKREVEADVSFDWATNSRMPRGAVALLVILWAKLVLPKRISATETALRRTLVADDDQASAPAEEAPLAVAAAEKPAVPPVPTVSRDALYAEFGRKFGKTSFARYVGQLKNAGFLLEDRLGNLREGPLLDLLVDGVEMAQKLRDSVLWDLLERDGGADPLDDEADDAPSDDDDDTGDDA
jgi:hypothetical protein